RDWDAARVRRERGGGFDDRVQLRPDLLLDVEVLDNGLDDEVAVGERLEVGRAAHARERRVALGRRELALLDLARVPLLDPREALVHEALLDVAERDLEARLRRDLRDAVPHLSRSEDADPPDLHARAIFRAPLMVWLLRACARRRRAA